MADSDNDLPVIDLAATEGYIVDDTDEDDPVLLAPMVPPLIRGGRIIHTKTASPGMSMSTPNVPCKSNY